MIKSIKSAIIAAGIAAMMVTTATAENIGRINCPF